MPNRNQCKLCERRFALHAYSSSLHVYGQAPAGLPVTRDGPRSGNFPYKEVLKIDPLRLDVNELIAEAYEVKAEEATDPTEEHDNYLQAIDYLKAELALSPVTPVVTSQLGDTANNAHAHWALAEIYEHLGMNANAKSEYQLYLDASKWHSNVYPWRITLAQKKIQTLGARQSQFITHRFGANSDAGADLAAGLRLPLTRTLVCVGVLAILASVASAQTSPTESAIASDWGEVIKDAVPAPGS